MPSIRKIERVVPLKICDLSIKEFSTRINNTEYRLGIYHHYLSGKVPLPVQDKHRKGGFKQDFDELGFPVPPGHSVLLPGDVSYRTEDDIPIRYDTEEKENEYRQKLRRYKLAKERYDELTTNGVTLHEYFMQLRQNPDDWDNEEENEIRMNLIMTVGRPNNWLDWNIEDLETKLLVFDCRRNQSKPPFTCYIQLTIQKENSNKVQLFEYNKKLFEAAKQLNEVLFGFRTFPIYVSNFHFGYKKMVASKNIYRLPIGFSLYAKEVDSSDYMIDHKNFKSIVKNSENLDSLHICCPVLIDGADFHIPTVLNSKKLVIVCLDRRRIQRLAQIARGTSSFDFQIKSKWEFSRDEYFEVYQSWLSGNRSIGAMFRVALEKEEAGEELLQLIRDRSERTETTERCVTVFINEFMNIEVFYEPCTDPPLTVNERKRYCWRSTPRLTLKMRIVKA